MMLYQHRFSQTSILLGKSQRLTRNTGENIVFEERSFPLWPGIVVREVGEFFSSRVIKSWKSTKIFSKSWYIVIGKLSTKVYVINTRFAKFAALNWSFSSDV